MSDCWTSEDYNEVLDFVEKYLWLFVQENSAIHKPKQIVCNLTQLNYHQLRLLELIYFLLSVSVQKSVRECTPSLLRHLAQSTDRVTTKLKGSVRGNVNWNLTLKHRLSKGLSDRTLFVTGVPNKTYDIPEMQALKYLLTQINRLCIEVLGNIPESGEISYKHNKKWKEEIRCLYYLTSNFLKNTYLREISLPGKITDMLLQKLRCARNSNFKIIYNSLRLYRRLFSQQENETLRDCLAQGVLKPLNRDTLYEVYILFVTLTSLEQAGWNRENLKLIGYGKGAVAHYTFENKILRVYYQIPTTLAQNSLYIDLMKQYGLDVSLRRPDILLEFDNNKCDFKLLEVKRTQDKRYILDSFYKVLGYLKDFEKCLISENMPNGMLVVWDGVEGTSEIDNVVAVLNRHNFRSFLEKIIKLD